MNENGQNTINEISVIGVGHAGINTLENIPKEMFENINFIYANTNKNILKKFDPRNCIYFNVGEKTNDEINVDANPKIGELAAEQSINEIRAILKNTKLLIVTTGLGGETGSGATPVISRIAKEMGILTVAIVTMPFTLEGSKRKKNANIGLDNLKKYVDSIFVISNDKLALNYPDIALIDAFQLSNNVLKNCIKVFSDLMLKSSISKLDFMDLTTAIKDKGIAYLGFGKGVGKNKIFKAINSAINSKIIDSSIKGANNVMLNIIADPTFSILQINNIIDILKEQANNDDLNVSFGFNIDSNLRNEIQISIIATTDQIDTNKNQIHENINLKDTQEMLLKIRNTLELEINGQSSNLGSESNIDTIYQKESENQEEIFIKFENNDDDDIPFFLK